MHLAAGPFAAAVFVLGLLVATWRRPHPGGSRQAPAAASERPTMLPAMQRRFTRQAYGLLGMSAFCVIAATVTGEALGYLIGAVGALTAAGLLYYVTRRS